MAEMTDWIGQNAWVVWVGIAVLLAILEMFSVDLVLSMFAIGALSAAAAAALGAPFWLAVGLFAVIATALLTFARPPIVARMHAGPTLTTGHAALVGRTAVVLEPVDRFGGRVTLASETWSARTDDETPIAPGAEVVVTRIDGATAVITAKES